MAGASITAYNTIFAGGKGRERRAAGRGGAGGVGKEDLLPPLNGRVPQWNTGSRIMKCYVPWKVPIGIPRKGRSPRLEWPNGGNVYQNGVMRTLTEEPETVHNDVIGPSYQREGTKTIRDIKQLGRIVWVESLVNVCVYVCVCVCVCV